MPWVCEKTVVNNDSLDDSAGVIMKRFVEGADRAQATLLPKCLEDWIDEDNPVRAVDAFVHALDLTELGFDGVEPPIAAKTRRKNGRHSCPSRPA